MYETSDSAIHPSSGRGSAVRSRLRLLIVFEQRLHREAFAALAGQDGRFDVVVATAGSRSWKAPSPRRDQSGVVLAGAECREKQLRSLLGGQRLRGGVLLVGPGHGPELKAPDPKDKSPTNGNAVEPVYRVDQLSLSLAASDAAWATVADKLLRAPAFDADPTARLAETSPGARTVATELAKHAKLTRREKQILAALGSGQSPREVGEHLHIAVSTVENHKARLMKKLDVHKSIELVRFAIRVGVARL